MTHDEWERAERILDALPISYAIEDHGSLKEANESYDEDVAIIAAALAEVERRVWREVWNEVARIQGNGSPMTDFGKGVIAATKDMQTFICERSEAQARKEA